jgi:plasmid maintenance system antidote protein VapI
MFGSGGAMYTRTELANILRVYGYTFEKLAADTGITKSYLSKIINRKVESKKHEKIIGGVIRKLQKTKPENVNKGMKPWSWRDRRCPKARDLPLRNEFQNLLDREQITITELAQNIGEDRSSVSQVIVGLRHTRRIINKLAEYFRTDSKIYFDRQIPAIVKKKKKGILVPLGTDGYSIKIAEID